MIFLYVLLTVYILAINFYSFRLLKTQQEAWDGGENDEKYAVMNADGWLKEKATGVIGYCEEDGVAKFLAERFKL